MCWLACHACLLGGLRMKILYHHRTVSRDGQSVHIEEMIKAMRALGHEVIIAAPKAHEATDIGGSSALVDWLKKAMPRWVYELMELGYSLRAFVRLWRAYRQHKPDAIYERYNLFLLSGLWLKRLSGLPFVLEVNAPLTDERAKFGGLSLIRLARWCDNITWRGADYVLPVTNVLADYVRATGVDETHIKVIPNGINRAEFPKGERQLDGRRELGLEDAVVLGFAGFIRDWHGLDRVVDILTEDMRAHLLVVGDGPARQSVEDRARELNVSDRVHILGFVPRDKVARYVAAFDIALQPDVVPYASPLKMFEYLALGCAIVAPDMPNIREILNHEENALLFDPDQPDALLAAIRRLIQDDSIRRKLGQAASDTIENKGLTWENNARRVLSLIS